MPYRSPHLALLAAAALSACGGGAGAPPPTTLTIAPAPAPASPAPAALSASTTALALAVSGRPRQVSITNTGGQPAPNLVITGSESLPSDTLLATDCSTLAPGASCMLTLMAGNTPSAAPGATIAMPARLTITDGHANTVALSVEVVGIGSVYQGGRVFHIDDTTPDTGSIGGKALGLTTYSHPWSAPLDGTVIRADRWDVVENARSLTDGEANTQAIVAHMGQQVPPLNPGAHAAGVCSESSEGGQTDWYLPAICELAYDGSGTLDMCGTQAQPLVPNVKSRLIDTNLLAGYIYLSSSTEDGASAESTEPGTLSPIWTLVQDRDDPSLPFGQIVREAKIYPTLYACVRTLTP